MESRTLWQIVCVLLVAVLSEFAFGVELTFELLDNKRDCFYEEIQKNTTCVLEFQVIVVIFLIIFNLTSIQSFIAICYQRSLSCLFHTLLTIDNTYIIYRMILEV